jgi:hypothetical protein
MLWQHQPPLYHNDVHAENVLLGEWPADVDQMVYRFGSKQDAVYVLDKKQSPLFAYLIDYGTMTIGEPLNDKYLPAGAKNAPPFLDMCEFLGSFQPYKELKLVNSFDSKVCRNILDFLHMNPEEMGLRERNVAIVSSWDQFLEALRAFLQ